MKPPIKNIDDLMEMWSEDAAMDESEPGRELIRVPKLQSKYLHILTHHNLICKKLTSDYNRMRKLKWEYYSGDLNNPEDLEKYGLEPIQKKILRQDIPIYLDSDDELNTLLLKRQLHEEIVEFCKTVLKEIHSRTFQLKSFIEWERFIRGQQ